MSHSTSHDIIKSVCFSVQMLHHMTLYYRLHFACPPLLLSVSVQLVTGGDVLDVCFLIVSDCGGETLPLIIPACIH